MLPMDSSISKKNRKKSKKRNISSSKTEKCALPTATPAKKHKTRDQTGSAQVAFQHNLSHKDIESFRQVTSFQLDNLTANDFSASEAYKWIIQQIRGRNSQNPVFVHQHDLQAAKHSLSGLRPRVIGTAFAICNEIATLKQNGLPLESAVNVITSRLQMASIPQPTQKSTTHPSSSHINQENITNGQNIHTPKTKNLRHQSVTPDTTSSFHDIDFPPLVIYSIPTDPNQTPYLEEEHNDHEIVSNTKKIEPESAKKTLLSSVESPHTSDSDEDQDDDQEYRDYQDYQEDESDEDISNHSDPFSLLRRDHLSRLFSIGNLGFLHDSDDFNHPLRIENDTPIQENQSSPRSRSSTNPLWHFHSPRTHGTTRSLRRAESAHALLVTPPGFFHAQNPFRITHPRTSPPKHPETGAVTRPLLRVRSELSHLEPSSSDAESSRNHLARNENGASFNGSLFSIFRPFQLVSGVEVPSYHPEEDSIRDAWRLPIALERKRNREEDENMSPVDGVDDYDEMDNFDLEEDNLKLPPKKRPKGEEPP